MAEVQLNPIVVDNGSMKVEDISYTLELTKDTLNYSLKSDYPSVYGYLCRMGLLWPDSTWTQPLKSYQYYKCFVMRLFMVYLFGYGCFFAYWYLHKNNLMYGFIGCSIALQAVVLLPSLPVMTRRLNEKCFQVDLEFYQPSIPYSRLILLVSVAFGFIIDITTYCEFSSSCNSALVPTLVGVNAMSEICVSYALAVTSVFVQVDCKVSVKLLDDLIVAHQEKRMTIEMYNEFRANIKHRVDSNFWVYNSVIFVAIINILLLIVLLYIGISDPVVPIVFLKETPFVLTALYYSMKVNESADKLTGMLGSTIWSKEDIDQVHNRLFYYSNAEANRISFPLAGMVLKQKDLVFRVGGSIAAFFLGILKSALLNDDG